MKLDQVIVHPLVLLSVVDNYNRVAQNTRKRVVGVLLGEVKKGVVHVTNSYAVPFEEDESDGGVWFMDYTYHENMYAMFRKINAREVVVGWYSTGPRIRDADLEINQLMTKYCKQVRPTRPRFLPPARSFLLRSTLAFCFHERGPVKILVVEEGEETDSLCSCCCCCLLFVSPCWWWWT